MTFLDITDLELTFEPVSGTSAERSRALDGASLAVERGELVALVGESGSGKSTLARAIVGLHRPGEILGGSVRLDGRELVGADTAVLRNIRGAQVGLAFQDASIALDPVYSIGSQIIEAMDAVDGTRGLLASLGVPFFGDRTDRGDQRDRAADLLREVGIDDPVSRLGSYPSELSGGQRQRAMLATALAGDPDLLICDEPTAGLDATTRRRVLGLLSGLASERDLGLLVITHDLACVAEHCDRVAVLSEGAVVETGPTTAIIEAPSHPETRSLVEAARDLTIGGGGGPRSAVDGGTPAPGRQTADPLVELRDVSKVYPLDSSIVRRFRGTRATRTALDGVSLSLRPGETLGLVGESGGGKSTVLKLIAGLQTPTEGAVWISGRRVDGLGTRNADLCSEIGVVFQQPRSSLDPRWSVGRSITEPLRRLGWSEPQRRERLDELLERVGLSASVAEATPRQLSGGQVQRAAVARATAADPRILLLDEPVSALDATTRARVLSLLVTLQGREDRATVFVSHDLGAVGRVADRIAVLENGRLVELGDAGRVIENPAHSYTRQLLDSVPALPTGAMHASEGD